MADGRTYEQNRPFGVIVIVVLMWIQGFFELIGGLFLFLERNDIDLQRHLDASDGTIATLAILTMVLGVITLLLANFLAQGSNIVRLFVGLVSLFNLASAIWGLFAFEGTAWANAIFQGVIAVLVLYILFGNRESQEFFGDTP